MCDCVREGAPTSVVRVGAKYLIDAPPGLLVAAPSQPPELARPGGVHVARPRSWGGWEGGEGQSGEEGSYVQPGTRPIRSPRGEIRPGADIETAKGAKEFMIIQAFKAEGEGSEERVWGSAKRGGEPERRIRAQSAKTAAPDRRGGEGADETPMMRVEEGGA